MCHVPIQARSNSAELLPELDELRRLLDAIEFRAYHSFAARGFQHGQDLDDWLEAERQVLGAPAAAVSLEPDQLVLRVALGGFRGDEVKLFASPCDLVLRAETASPVNGDGQFRLKAMRHFAMPPDVDVQHATADLDNGVLTIRAPKMAAVPV